MEKIKWFFQRLFKGYCDSDYWAEEEFRKYITRSVNFGLRIYKNLKDKGMFDELLPFITLFGVGEKEVGRRNEG